MQEGAQKGATILEGKLFPLLRVNFYFLMRIPVGFFSPAAEGVSSLSESLA